MSILKITSLRIRLLLQLRTLDTLTRDSLPQYHKSITDLLVGAPDRDVALIVRAFHQSIGRDSGARNVVDLFKALPPLSDNVGGGRIWDGHSHEVTVRFTLLRERLCKVEGEGIRRDSTLLGRFFLLG